MDATTGTLEEQRAHYNLSRVAAVELNGRELTFIWDSVVHYGSFLAFGEGRKLQETSSMDGVEKATRHYDEIVGIMTERAAEKKMA